MSALKAALSTLAFVALAVGGVAAGVALLMRGYPFPAAIATAALLTLAVRVMLIGLAWAYPR